MADDFARLHVLKDRYVKEMEADLRTTVNRIRFIEVEISAYGVVIIGAGLGASLQLMPLTFGMRPHDPASMIPDAMLVAFVGMLLRLAASVLVWAGMTDAVERQMRQLKAYERAWRRA